MLKKEVKRILAVRSDRFGEFLLNIPAIRALKETFSQGQLTVAVNSSVVELARAVECIDEVVVWDEAFRKGLRKERFDLCVILNPTKEAHWAAFWAGIPLRVGYNRKWGFLLTHKLKDTKGLGIRHEVYSNLELVGLIGATTQDKTVSIAVSQCPRMEFYGQEAVAIHPFTSDTVKQWPVERFMELAGLITRELKAKVIFVGKTKDGRGIERNKDNLEAIDLVNKTSLMELACVLKQCKLLVTCDSGPMHLACAVGTPVVALFRNDMPGKTAHRWGPWGKNNLAIEKPNLNDITVNNIVDSIRKLLQIE
ncbi:MAG: glycosyltransferase family 9 protein [Candidatus Omnitrophota bacterium]